MTLAEKLAGYRRLIGQFPVRQQFRPSVDIFPNDLRKRGDDLSQADFSDWELADLTPSEIEGCPLNAIVIKRGEEIAVIIVR